VSHGEPMVFPVLAFRGAFAEPNLCTTNPVDGHTICCTNRCTTKLYTEPYFVRWLGW